MLRFLKVLIREKFLVVPALGFDIIFSGEILEEIVWNLDFWADTLTFLSFEHEHLIILSFQSIDMPGRKG